MTERVCLTVTRQELKWIQQALSVLAESDRKHAPKVLSLIDRVGRATQDFPDITVGVYGGLVQWVLGNPFPIRICDYDGEDVDLNDVDSRGQKCNTWLEPPSV